MEQRIRSLPPTPLLRLLDRIYNTKVHNQSNTLKSWNENELLNHQIMSKETTISLAPHEIDLCLGKLKLRTFTVKNHPEEWALMGMGALIGDAFNEWLRMPCPFILHFGACILPQEKSKQALFQKNENH